MVIQYASNNKIYYNICYTECYLIIKFLLYFLLSD